MKARLILLFVAALLLTAVSLGVQGAGHLPSAEAGPSCEGCR